MFVDSDVRKTLEADAALSLFADRARSQLGQASLLQLMPCPDLNSLKSRQDLLAAYLKYTSERGNLPWQNGLEPIGGLLEEARHSGLMMGEELLKVRNILVTALQLKEQANAARSEYPPFSFFCSKIRDFPDELQALTVVNTDGSLADGASTKLREIRETLENVRVQARRIGNSFLNGPQSSLLQEKVISLRSGRFSVLVKGPSAGHFPGIVTDRSTSGNSVYMEPHALVPLNNRLAALLEDQRQEERRILREITAVLLNRRAAIEDAEEALGRLDLLYSATEMIDAQKWNIPELSQKSEFTLRNVHHPLLGDRAVPIDIYCGREFRALVVTGPNTGGKTVALKTAALAIFLAWCGLPIPAEEGSVIGTLSSLYVDIGDEQSIEQNLSTFSSHLRRIVTMLEKTDKNSLVLLDELGAGTDPQEGAALGIAVLEEFLRRGTLVLATTHHNAIKRFAVNTPNVEAACVDFDLKTLSPTYHLLIGIPGQSNALAIARRYGMPQSIIDRAAHCLDSGEIDAEKLIAQLQQKRASLDKLEHDLNTQKQAIEKEEKGFIASRNASKKQRDELILKAEQESQRVIDEAEQKARAMIKDLQGVAESAAQKELAKHKKNIDVSRDRSVVRQKSIEARYAPAVDTLKVGATVRLTDGKAVGEILSISGKKAEVQVGPMRITVPLTKLTPAKAPGQSDANSVAVVSERPLGVPSSIMVRGMSIDEAMPIVESYLDRAMRAGYGEVTVIHGRGEGILRRQVQELCERLPYVSDYRLGEHGEGGYGVTIVRFR